MTSERRHNSDALLSCVTKVCNNQCDNDCNYIKNDTAPFGVTIIPGSGKLYEYPSSVANLSLLEESNELLSTFSNVDVCPKEFPHTSICVRECSEFTAIAHVNFINGDLVIGDPSAIPAPFQSSLAIVPPNSNQFSLFNGSNACPADATDILPNLLGVNGSIYVIGTQYCKITGFDKLRFVTGSIVFANNPNLISLPTFPSLLNVSAQPLPAVTQLSPFAVPAAVLPAPARCDPGAIVIVNNNALRKIVGFEALRQVKDGIFISDNACLTSICGFIHLYRTDKLVIANNPKLAKIIGFCYTDTFNKGLYLLDNNIDGEYDLTINAFVALETAGTVVITGNNFLKSFKLDELRTVQNDFIVRSNAGLEEISSSVHFVNNLFIEGNKNLVSIKFPKLREVNQSLSISGNAALIVLENFDELKRVGAGIVIADNGRLSELKGFNKLKYVGSSCVKPQKVPTPIGFCSCNAAIVIDWEAIFSRVVCTVTVTFDVTLFDGAVDACAYFLPIDFFILTCNPLPPCNQLPPLTEEVPDIISYSIIIFRNMRLKAIGGFACLKHLESSLYIVDNAVLHTIHSFGQLAFALDVWIRNNSSLKYIIGFNNLISIRDFVALESVCLLNLDNIRSLEYAQNIALEAKSANSVKLARHPIPSVLGYILYYSFDNFNNTEQSYQHSSKDKK